MGALCEGGWEPIMRGAAKIESTPTLHHGQYPDCVFDLVVLDGISTYYGLKKAAETAFPMTRLGGRIVFHDYGSLTAVEDFYNSFILRYVDRAGLVDGLAMAKVS